MKELNHKKQISKLQKIMKKVIKLGAELDRFGIPLDLSYQNETMLRQTKEKKNEL